MAHNMLNQIIRGDCVEEMKKLPAQSVHLIITSPPYNVGIDYGVDDRKDYKDYLSFCRNWLSECYRLLIDGGRIAINLPSSILQSANSRMAYLTIDYLMIMREIGFLDREWITWLKMPKGEVPAKSTAWGSWCSPSCPYLRDAVEYIIVMDKTTHKRVDRKGQNDITASEFLEYTSNCWYIQPEKDRRHPAPFPFELPKRLIKLYSWKGDTVLDPFVGSGTTAYAAKILNRNFIGIEINKQFVNMANEKINIML